MAFNPSSTIYLCNVPIDNTYKNQIYFGSSTDQRDYFASKVVKSFTDYLTVRRTMPNGSLQSSVKVNANIDTLQSLGVNYMYYQNANHGTKLFYAFITQMIYINDGTTELVFETDVYQTWRFETTLLKSYVVREHSASDSYGTHIVPEKFTFQDYIYEEAFIDSSLIEWGYLVGCTELNFETTSTSAGHLMSNIYQGLYFYYYENENNLADFLSELENDCVQFICVIPKFCVSANSIGANETDREAGQGFMYSSATIANKTVGFTFKYATQTFSGYEPKNKKLLTAPYVKLIVTNHNGDQGEYTIEDFYHGSTSSERNIHFNMYGDVSANPSITLIPLNYKNIGANYDSGISISGFPQCSYASDTFKLWLAKNQYGLGVETVGNMGSIIAGIAGTVATGGIGGVVGSSMVASGVSGILGTISNVYQASKEPNKGHSGNTRNNLLTAIKRNKFSFYIQKIKKEYAQTIDDFFTMYGYQTNRVKTPNVSARRAFNYIQTVDVNIKGGIPNDDMQKLKAMYNNGVTLWKPHITVGDYSVDNSPTASE